MNLEPGSCRVGICGIGQMGTSAAVCFSRSGYDVVLWGRNVSKIDAIPATLDSLHSFLDEHFGSELIKRGTVELTSELTQLDEKADVILECVTEDIEQKAEFLRRLPHAAQRRALFLSTTSGLSITEMGRRSGLQELLVGAHFWNPAHLMPIVEVIRGDDTLDDRMEITVELMKRIGKTPVRVERDIPGFIGNRLQHAFWREAIHLVETGVATPEDIDLVASQTFGLRLPAVGPFANIDLVGLPLVAQVQSYLLADLSTSSEVMSAIKNRIASGERGMNSGQGFYDWSTRDANEVIARRDRQIVNQLKFLNSLTENNSKAGNPKHDDSDTVK